MAWLGDNLISESKFWLYTFAFDGTRKQWRYPLCHSTPLNRISFLRDAILVDARKLIEETYSKASPSNVFEWNLGLQANFIRADDLSVIPDAPPYFPTPPLKSLETIYEMDIRMEEAFRTITSKIYEYESKRCAWISPIGLDMFITHISNHIGL